MSHSIFNPRASTYSRRAILDCDDLDHIPIIAGNSSEEDILDWIQTVDELFEDVYVPLEKQS